MKNLILSLAIIFSSFIAKGEGEVFTYKVISITQCLIRDGEVLEGETTFPKDNRTIYIDEKEVSVLIEETNTKITFDIKDCYFDDGNLVYVTTHRLSKDEGAIIVKRLVNGIYTFGFINFNKDNCYVYKVQYID